MNIKSLHQEPFPKESNIVWLASYPRSGNTLIRIMLNHNFGLKTYSIYNDTTDIGKISAVKEIVGHQDMDWSFIGKETYTLKPEDYAKFDKLRYESPDLSLIKTHSAHHTGFENDKVIYIYRDGRSALRSFASYRRKFNNSRYSKEELMDQLLCCGTFSDRLVASWQDHILSWINQPKDKVLFLKYESAINNPQNTIDKISSFLNIDPLREDIISFEKLNNINKDFFRKGEKNSWTDLFDKKRQALFWILNYKAMSVLGYENDKSPVCKMLPVKKKESAAGKKLAAPPANGFSLAKNKENLPELDDLLMDSAHLLNDNLGSCFYSHKQALLEHIKNLYPHFENYYKSSSANYSAFRGLKMWESLCQENAFINNYDQLIQMASTKKDENNIIVITFGNIGYKKIILHWLRQMQKIRLNNYMVIALDTELYDLLNYFRFNTAKCNFRGNFGELMTFRSLILKKILENNINIIHSDADAFWLKNPINNYFAGNKYDILSSQGTIWPEEVLNVWGFVLCNGFIYYKSSEHMIAFFDDFIKQSAKFNDDQKAFNCLLYKKNIQWLDDDCANYLLEYQRKEFRCFSHILEGKSKEFRLGLLPHQKFQRYPEGEGSDIYIAHFLSDKDETAKMNVLNDLMLDESKVDSMIEEYENYKRAGNL